MAFWTVIKKRRLVVVKKKNTTYLKHKEAARTLIVSRLEHYNQFYGFIYNRVAIRDQRRCWGSCSSKGNLNFSYKLLFLPPCLRDYVIAHELCHLAELNHSASFWNVVARFMPDCKQRAAALRRLERKYGTATATLQKMVHSPSCQFCLADAIPRETMVTFPAALLTQNKDSVIS